MSEMERDIDTALKPLNDRERHFAREYAAMPNHHHAALQAGYSKTSARSQGYQLIKKNKIRKAVNLIREKNELEAGISHVDLARQLMTIAKRCQQAEPVLNKNGEPIGVYSFDARNAIAALDILCKMGGHYAPKKVDVDSTVTFIQHFGSDDNDQDDG